MERYQETGVLIDLMTERGENDVWRSLTSSLTRDAMDRINEAYEQFNQLPSRV